MPRRTLDDLMNGPSDDERDVEDDDTAVMNPVENRTDDLLDEEDYLPQPVQRTSKLTLALVAALVCGVGLVGGIWIQKQFGAATSAASGAFPGAGGQGAPGGGFPGGAPSGGFPGGAPSGASPGAGGQPGGANGGGASTGPGSEATTSPLAVVGTVTAIKGNRLTVTDLGDRRRSVTLADTTPITTPFSAGELAVGDTVSVYGTAGSGDTIQATAVTVR